MNELVNEGKRRGSRKKPEEIQLSNEQFIRILCRTQEDKIECGLKQQFQRLSLASFQNVKM